VSEIPPYLAFCDGPRSQQHVLSFIPGGADVGISLFEAEKPSQARIRLPELGWPSLLAIVNSAATNTGVRLRGDTHL
jgi:hypothetical protein